MIPSTAGLSLPAGAAIDLHLHTNLSDGDWSLDALLVHLRQEKFGLAAVTDHDRADTASAVQAESLESGQPLLTGVEMTSSSRGEMVDLLCYGFSPGDNPLVALASELLERQRETTREIFQNLTHQGYHFPADSLDRILEMPGLVQALRLIDLLIEQGSVDSRAQAEELLTGAGYRYQANSPGDVVEAAHGSGAVCLLAHPGRGSGYLEFDSDLLDRFRQEAPIDGLEAYYPLHTPRQTAAYLDYARRAGLLVSAGSDSHRPQKPPVNYRAEQCRELLERMNIIVS